jgi:hypothetical protein
MQTPTALNLILGLSLTTAHFSSDSLSIVFDTLLGAMQITLFFSFSNHLINNSSLAFFGLFGEPDLIHSSFLPFNLVCAENHGLSCRNSPCPCFDLVTLAKHSPNVKVHFDCNHTRSAMLGQDSLSRPLLVVAN